MSLKQKQKICKLCGGESTIFSKGLCRGCANKQYVKKTIANKKLKVVNANGSVDKAATIAKLKRKFRAKPFLEKDLDKIFSKWVRLAYPKICHSTQLTADFKDVHCSHFIGRANRCTRFDTRNCYPCLAKENMYNQLHVLELAKRLREYYNIDYDDYINASKQTMCKISTADRKRLADVFKWGTSQVEHNDSENHLKKIRDEVIEQTKFIL